MHEAASTSAPSSIPERESVPVPEGTPSFGLKKLLVLLGVAALVLPLVHFTPLGAALADMQSLRDRLDGEGIEYELKFFAIVAVLIAIGAPRLMFFALAGLLFGLVEGFVAAMAASMVGSLATFLLIRWLGRDWVAAHFGRNRFFAKITHIRPTALSVFFVRQLPVSGVFINATLALSTVRSRAFLLGSFFGFAPQGVVALLIGSGVSADFIQEGLLQLIAAGVGLAGLAFWIWRTKFAKNSLRETDPNFCNDETAA